MTHINTFKQKILFTEQECDLILKEYIDKPIGTIEQKTYVSWISKNIDSVKDSWILDRLVGWFESELNIKIDWDNAPKKEFYLQSYIKGDKFAKHNDNAYNRVYGMGVLLNDEFEGGHTSFQQLSISVKPIIGSCLLFYYDTDITKLKNLTSHGGNVVTCGTKYAATVWMKNHEPS